MGIAYVVWLCRKSKERERVEGSEERERDKERLECEDWRQKEKWGGPKAINGRCLWC